jgi:type VI secretion system protein VasD
MLRTNLVIALFTLILVGCGSDPEKPVPEPPQTIIDTQITASCQVNPDVNGRPSPIVVRIYELKSMGKFEEADFYKLFDDYASLLSSDLLASEQFNLHPGDTKVIRHVVSPETKFVAITAAYRDLNKAVWRNSIPIETAKTTQFKFMLDPLGIDITIPLPATNNHQVAPGN